MVSIQDRIKNHLLKYGSITTLEALSQYNCMRLAARIHVLREQGMNIGGDWTHKGSKVYRYTLLDRTKTIYEAVERDGEIVRVPRVVHI